MNLLYTNAFLLGATTEIDSSVSTYPPDPRRQRPPFRGQRRASEGLCKNQRWLRSHQENHRDDVAGVTRVR